MINNSKEYTIVVVGRTGAGKSYICNKLAGEECFKTSNAVYSETLEPQCKVIPIKRNSLTYSIKIVDTPGIGDNRVDESTKEPYTTKIFRNIFGFIKTLQGGFNVGVLCINANKPRVDAEELRDLENLGRILGNDVFDHMVIALTQTNLIPKSSKQSRIDDYKNNLPKMFQDRGIKTRIDVVDAGDDSVGFKDDMISRGLKTDNYESEALKKIDLNDSAEVMKLMQSPEVIGYINEQVQGMREQLENDLKLEKEMFQDQARMKELELKIEQMEREQEQLKESDGPASFMKMLGNGLKLVNTIIKAKDKNKKANKAKKSKKQSEEVDGWDQNDDDFEEVDDFEDVDDDDDGFNDFMQTCGGGIFGKKGKLGGKYNNFGKIFGNLDWKQGAKMFGVNDTEDDSS